MMLRSPFAPREGEGEGQAGFTLVELLVAITLFSLLSVLLVNALRFGTKAWERGNQHSTRLDETAHAQALLRRLLTDAYPSFVVVPASPCYVDFEGSATSLTFLADGPMSLDYGGRLRFTLSTQQRKEETDLVLSTNPELPYRETPDLSARRIVLANIGPATFAYFGQKRGDKAARWYDDWQREAALPDMLRIKVAFNPGDAGAWPELVIRPRIEADVSCVYDTLAKRCRGR